MSFYSQVLQYSSSAAKIRPLTKHFLSHTRHKYILDSGQRTATRIVHSGAENGSRVRRFSFFFWIYSIY
jgi:hypothetical protein